MEIKDKTIALLIDSDNVSREYFSILLDELSKYGRVTYRRLYGDFSKPNANGWRPALLEYSIEQRQQMSYTNGKNATDSVMIIDAMDILYKGKVDCFCLATSDSDFTGLAMRFRNDNIVVIGAGEAKTPNSFRKACERFIPIDELLKEKEKAEALLKKPAPKKERTAGKAKPTAAPASEAQRKCDALISMATQIILDGSDSEGWMNFSAFMNEIWRKENDFNPKLYGFSNSNALPFFKSLRSRGKASFLFEKRNSTDIIKLNNQDNPSA